jgi:hypothetical protein
MAAGGTVHDGDIVYFPDHATHRFMRGTAYHNINNMWWVCLASGRVTNMASFELYRRQDLTTLRGRHFRSGTIQEKLKALLSKAVKSQSFERAIVLRDIIRTRFPQEAAA